MDAAATPDRQGLRVAVAAPARGEADIAHDPRWQFTAFVLMALQGLEGVSRLWLVHEAPLRLPQGLQLADMGATAAEPHELTHRLDWVIDIDATLPAEWLRRLRRLGTRVVEVLRGNPYADALEPALFGLAPRWAWPDAAIDEVWCGAALRRTCQPMLQAVARAPVWEMPRLWSPLFAQRRAQALAGAGHPLGFVPGVRAGQRGWRVLVAEANASVVGNCVVPMLATEAAYRGCAQAVACMMVLHTFERKEHPTFNALACNLDLTRDGLASYEPGLAVLDALAAHRMDCVVGHQWEQEMRDDWCEVLWAGYPLVHNSQALREQGLGLSYADFDATDAAAALLAGWRLPASFWSGQRCRALAWLATLHPLGESVQRSLAQHLRLPAAPAAAR